MSKELNIKSELQEALRLHQTANLDAAAIIYNNVLKKQPHNIDAISLLGTLYLQTGNFDDARVLLEKSLALNPDNAITHNNLGSVLQASGKFNDAIKSYKQSIALKPDYDEAYYNLGNAYQAVGQLEDAVTSYKHATALNPNDADIHCNLANVLRKIKSPEEAVIHYQQAAKLMPLSAELHNNLGAALQELGKMDEAILSCQQAIKLNPEYAESHNNLGTALRTQQKLEDAIECFNKAIEIKPDYAEAYYNLGSALHTTGTFDKAIDAFNSAIAIMPDYAKAHYNLGNTLKEQNRLEDAIVSYNHAIALKPDYVMAHNNLGTILQALCRIDEAAECYSRAIELKPDYAEAHLNKALTSLLNGNLKSGWQEYEWRLQTKNYSFKNFNQPMWDGKPLHGKTILIHTEQGFGDTIQFIRYLPMVQEQGGRVIFECLPNLISLLKNCNGFDKIIEKKPSVKLSEKYDVHVPLLSLPKLFETTLDTIPSGIPYITVEPDLVEQWRLRLNDDHKYKVGIVWAGNPEHTKDHNRSCSLSDFATLSEISEVSLYSLQKGPASVEIDKSSDLGNIINLGNEINDFTDTAAIIANLDLVISVDTVVAHLAGAIGKPVWTLLPFEPDWRWLLDREDSPWYPDMRLFRQAQPDDWAEMFTRVKQALSEEVDSFGFCPTSNRETCKPQMEERLVVDEIRI